MILIKNVRFAGEDATDGYILIEEKEIKSVGHGNTYQAILSPAEAKALEIVDGRGCLALPGAIDCHVHFREPGLTSKADIYSESRAAVAGGVTSYLEMPNTKPATTTIEAWKQKMDIAAEKSAANYAFFIGATNDNIEELRKADYTRVPGVKLFMGSSTGNMLVDDSASIRRIFDSVDAIVAVHTEEQSIIDANTAEAIDKYGTKENVPLKEHSTIRSEDACYESTSKAVAEALRAGKRLHVCHLSTAKELELLRRCAEEARSEGRECLITAEVSPHHLMWCDADYERKGTRIKMNPAVKTAADRDALRQALVDGTIAMVATDHAPHLPADKRGGALTAASGSPLVQFSLPWMLDHFDEDTVQRSMCENPACIYGIEKRGRLAPGYYADIVLVEETEPYRVSDADVISKCGWTPLDSEELHHRVVQTWVNGQCIMDNAQCRMHNSQCAMHNAECTIHNAECTSEDDGRHAAMPLRFSQSSGK